MYTIHCACHYLLRDRDIGIEFCQIRLRTPQLSVCKELQPALSPEFVQKHLQPLFSKIASFDCFAPHNTSSEKLLQLG